MSQPTLGWYELRWPREIDDKRRVEMLMVLATSSAVPIVLETVGTRTGVQHRLGLPARHAPGLLPRLRAALPGLDVAPMEERPDVELEQACEIRLSSEHRPLRTDIGDALSRALLTALSAPREGERLVMQWHLIRSLAPSLVGGKSQAPMSVGEILLRGARQLDAEERGALRAKRGAAGFALVGRLGVHAEHDTRCKQLLGLVIAALRIAEAPGARWHIRSTKPSHLLSLPVPWRVALKLNVDELAVVSGWPVGDARSLPVVMSPARRLSPSRAVPRAGRVIGVAGTSSTERPVAISATDSLRHLHAVGPTGTGKSTVLLNLVTQDMAAGRGVCLVEPKGDLVADVLARVPEHRLADVVLIDPVDEQSVVGVNPFAAHASPELVADRLLSVFHHLYASSWGPRTSDILFNACATLAYTPGTSMAALPLLLSDPAFRRRVVGGLDEPIVLQPFWQAFESWSEAERTAAVAPSMNKLRPLLVRRPLRAVLGQAEPKFDLRQLFTERKIVLVNLAKGTLGPEGSALLGSLLVSQLWQTTLERSTVPPERRHQVFVYIDEFQDYLSLPVDLADALAQARGLGVGLTLAHQHLGQLAPATRTAVLANARSRVVFQTAAEDARVFAATSDRLEPEDFQSLPVFEAYAQVVAGGAVQPWCSLRTAPAPPATSDTEGVARRSRDRYGIAPSVVDEAIKRLRDGSAVSDFGPRRRAGGRS